ncbi:MAG TPA: hypothetical protein VFZ61_22740 [Polyangiales bacterium]
MIWILPIWLCLFLTLVGIGLSLTALLARLAPTLRAPLGTFQLFWFGYAFTIMWLACGSLLLPIRWPLVAPLLLAALAGFWIQRGAVWARLRSWRARPRLALALCSITLVVVGVTAARAAQPVGWYDTHLYHLQVVQWARTLPAVPGVANLHYRLAYNNSIHLFAALTDCFWKNRAAHLALGLLACVTALQLIACALRPGNALGRLRAGYALLVLPFVLARIASNEIASLSSDLPLNLICVVIGLELLGWGERATPRRSDTSMALVLALSAVATTTKLGGLGVLIVSTATAAWTLRQRSFPRTLLAAWTLLPALVLSAYIARQAVLSGWLLFPAPIANLHFEWSLPESVTIDQFRWIQSWARMPGKEPAYVLDHGLWRWFERWFGKFEQSQELLLLALSAVVALQRLAQRKAAQLSWQLPALLAALLSLVLWFRGAPDLRFGAGFFWILLAVVAAPPLARMLAEPVGQWTALAICLALSSWSGGLSAELPHRDYRVKLPAPDKPAVREVELSPGLKVSVPEGDNDRCGNVPLPCTPYPAQQRARRPGDLRAGFLY